ncbi:MAG: GNAT family N-acetyltransferase [Acidimicrobiia bacterium]|nr:GNAT family N-acetyltransferase [Acidimicrobiia bacterium]
MFTVRRILSEDGEVLRRVRLAALADSPGAFAMTLDEEHSYPPERWVEFAARRASGDEEVTFLAFDDRDTAVGIVGGYRRSPTTADLVAMWVDPAARRHRLGRELVAVLIRWARGAGCSAVELWVTRGNDGAKRLYDGFGFTETGAVQPLPSDPCRNEIRMRLDLV